MKRPRSDTFVKVIVNGSSTVLATSLNELRMLDQVHQNDRGLQCLFWALVFGGRCALVELYAMPLQVHWCREHQDWCDIRAAGPERLAAVVDCLAIFDGRPIVRALPP